MSTGRPKGGELQVVVVASKKIISTLPTFPLATST